MKRRTLDIMFSVGGLALAALLVVLGLVLTNRANFARDNVHEQLGRETIEFKALEKLNDKERAYTEARSGCVIANAGQTVTNGKQAECYAEEYLGGHLATLATRLNMPSVAYVDGMNFQQLGTEQTRLRDEIAAAKTADPSRVAPLEKQLADVTTVRSKMFEGTMLRNALLTSYGFSVFGDTSDTAAEIAYGSAALMLLLSMAGLAHAFVTPRSKAFAVPEPAAGKA